MRNYVITNEQERPQTESAVLSMRFRVRKHHVHLGRIHVMCRASILDVYQSETDVEICVNGGGIDNDSGAGLITTKIVVAASTIMILLV